MSTNPCFELRDAGTAVWLDQLSRDIVESGTLARLRDGAALTGVTSNPAIFQKSMTQGSAYDGQLAEAAGRGLDTEAIYEELAIRDIQLACDVLAPVHASTEGADGFVSLEVSPHLARDTEKTLQAAVDLHKRVDRPNVLIKIPGTPEGTPAIEQALIAGVPVNVTLLFSLEAYESVAEAYLRAMEARAEKGLPLNIASVASFFVSRIDTLTDQKLEERAQQESGAEAEEILSLRGRAAIDNAKLAYQSFLRLFRSERFGKLEAKGARVQRPLWASTSTKNPEYRDVIYVETLVGRDTVNTMPMQTLEAMQDHGTVTPATVEKGIDRANRLFETLDGLGLSFKAITDQLLVEAIDKFIQPYDDLLASLEAKRAELQKS